MISQSQVHGYGQILSIMLANYYRPQGKVMFSEASVSHSVHRGRMSPLDREHLRQRRPRTETPWRDTFQTETP